MAEPVSTTNPLELLANKLSSSLLKTLAIHEPRVLAKYSYYNADNEIRDFGVSSPKSMINTMPGIGWASRSVNTLSDRVVFDGFANDTFGINDYWTSIGAYSVVTKAKHDGSLLASNSSGFVVDTGSAIVSLF